MFRRLLTVGLIVALALTAGCNSSSDSNVPAGKAGGVGPDQLKPKKTNVGANA
jgi:hypothetical protein